MARKASQRLADEAAACAVLCCDSSLAVLDSDGSPPDAIKVSRAVVLYWQRADDIQDAAARDGQAEFERSYLAAVRIAKVLKPHYLKLRARFIEANSRMGGVAVAATGREFSSANQCLYDLADGVVMAVAWANDPAKWERFIAGKTDGNFGPAVPAVNWPTVRDAIQKLQRFDMRGVIGLAEREAVLISDKVHLPTIPPQFRSKPIGKGKAASLLGQNSGSSGVAWLNQCVADGTITCERQSRQKFVFDVRQFPDSVHAQLKPQAALTRRNSQ